MSDESGFEIGQLTAQVNSLTKATEKLFKCVEGLQKDLLLLKSVVSEGKGFFAGALFMASALGAAVMFLLFKLPKLFGGN